MLVRARTLDRPVGCPDCGSPSQRVPGFCERTLADVSVDARPVAVSVRVRRLVCGNHGCARQTFREQVPGVLERHQRRTPRLAAQIGSVVRELAGRAGQRALSALAVRISRHTALRILMRQIAPGDPRSVHVENRVEQFPQVVLGRTAADAGLRSGLPPGGERGLDQRPAGVGQIGGIASAPRHDRDLPSGSPLTPEPRNGRARDRIESNTIRENNPTNRPPDLDGCGVANRM
jgi:hypothetical protein